MKPYADIILTDGPVGYWRMEETSVASPVLDSTGHGHNGSYHPTITLGTAGIVNNGMARLTSYTDQGFDIPDHVNLRIANTLTLELWVYKEVMGTGYAATWSKGTAGGTDCNFALYLFGDAAPGIEGYVGLLGSPGGTFQGLTSYQPMPLNEWVHIVVTYDATNGGKQYHNGVLVSSGAGVGALPITSTANILFPMLNGMHLDEAAIYNYILTPAQIRHHYETGLDYPRTVVEDGAVGYWRLNETAGAVAVDSIGTAHGDIFGGVTLGEPGLLGTSMRFNGSSGYIEVPASVLDCGPNTQSFSVEYWINPVVDGSGSPVRKGSAPPNTGGVGWELINGDPGAAETTAFFFGRTSFGACVRTWFYLNIGIWAYVVVTYNAVTHEVITYVDGVNVNSTILGDSMSTPGADIATYTDDFPFLIGKGSYGWTDGYIAEVALYDSVLSPANVAKHYRLGLGEYASTVIADGASHFWRLGETSGTRASDSIGNEDGTIGSGVTLAQRGVTKDRAMLFDATTDGVVTVLHDAFMDIGTTQSMSVECWVRFLGFESSNQNAIVFDTLNATDGNGPGFCIEAYGGGDDVFWAMLYEPTAGYGVFIDGPVSFVIGQWHHLVLVINRTTQKFDFYQDGVAGVTQDLPVGVSYTGATPFLIGRPNFFDVAFWGGFHGDIDEVAWYPFAMTQEMAQVHFGLGAVGRRVTGSYYQRLRSV